MGNDPANGTDPSGGFFGVGGSGCAAAAGMSGYGGMAGRIAGSGNFLKVVSTVSTVASAVAKGMGLGGSITTNMGNNIQSLNHSANSGDVGSSGSNAGSGGDDGKDGCPDCPKGYGPKPKQGKNQRPFYKGKNAAAAYWAVENKNKVYENSSLLYEVTSSDGTKLISTTAPLRWEHKGNALGSSPGLMFLMNKFKDKIPENAVIGHIHLHPNGTQRKNPSNIKFSNNDDIDYESKANYPILSRYRLYVLGSTGDLWVRYRKGDTRIDDDGNVQPIRIKSENLGSGFDSKPGARKDPPCPCYEQ